MAITQAMCTSFKVEILQGVHNFYNGSGGGSSGTGATFKIALYTSSATMSATTTAYSATNETSGTAYVAGGNSLTFTDGYANPELQPDSGNIIYIENRKPISRSSDQTEDIKLIVEF